MDEPPADQGHEAAVGQPVNQPAAGRMFCHSLSTMPIEWLVQVLDFLTTKNLFQLMRTNREWECGVKYVLKHRKFLTIGEDCDRMEVKDVTAAVPVLLKYMKNVRNLELEDDGEETMPLIAAHAVHLKYLYTYGAPIFTTTFPKLKKLYSQNFDASTTCFPVLEELEAFEIHNPTHENAFMPKLRKFLYRRSNEFEDHDEDVKRFLIRNADHLTSLQVDEDFGDEDVFGFNDENVVFKKLTHIKVNDFTFANKCPALTKLTVRKQESSSFTELPVTQMTDVKVDTQRMDDEMIESIFTTISKMINLKRLRLVTGDLCDNVFPDLLANMTQLEVVSVSVYGNFTAGTVISWFQANVPEERQTKFTNYYSGRKYKLTSKFVPALRPPRSEFALVLQAKRKSLRTFAVWEWKPLPEEERQNNDSV